VRVDGPVGNYYGGPYAESREDGSCWYCCGQEPGGREDCIMVTQAFFDAYVAEFRDWQDMEPPPPPRPPPPDPPMGPWPETATERLVRLMKERGDP
jgi:hypothetical protein